MSERWGDCRSCQGKGERVRKLVSTQGNPIPLTEAQSEQLCVPPGGREWTEVTQYIATPCPSCDGTGFSGDAMERPT